MSHCDVDISNRIIFTVLLRRRVLTTKPIAVYDVLLTS